MRTTEVSLRDENDLVGQLTDMRVWLDEHRYEPSTFTYFFLDPGMKIRVAFKLAAEAEAFAQEFRGVLLDIPWASDQAPEKCGVACALSKPTEQKKSHWTVPAPALLSPPNATERQSPPTELTVARGPWRRVSANPIFGGSSPL